MGVGSCRGRSRLASLYFGSDSRAGAGRPVEFSSWYRDGLFRAADGGTLFLDEVGELPGPLQAKLLRVLNDSEVRRVGDTETCKVNVRIIAATNRDLDALMESGEFRVDLFYRLSVIPLWIPPMRERPEDIEPMARNFLARYHHGRDFELSDEAVARLECQNWPGNGRQLENARAR